MNSWRKEPPTYKEWLDAKNHGHWWIKFIISSEFSEEVDGGMYTWPETWFTDIVTITCSHPDNKLFSGTGELHGSSSLMGKFDLSNKEKLKDVYWQPVAPPLDDTKDKRPEV